MEFDWQKQLRAKVHRENKGNDEKWDGSASSSPLFIHIFDYSFDDRIKSVDRLFIIVSF